MISSASSSRLFKLYGVPLSQPFRTVAWTMLQLDIPFDIQMVVPGSSNKYGTRHEKYLSLTGPLEYDQIPLLSVSANKESSSSSSFHLFESPAILSHLCETLDRSTTADTDTITTSLYPNPGSIEKARMDSYMHWHHSNTRYLSKLFAQRVRPDLKIDEKYYQERIQRVLEQLETGWLSETQTIAGTATPTIADLLAYGEVSTVTMTNLISLTEYSNLSRWMNTMSQLPHHDVAHTALQVLGDLKSDDDDEKTKTKQKQPLSKRLGAATKAGMKALQDAQSSDAS